MVTNSREPTHFDKSKMLLLSENGVGERRGGAKDPPFVVLASNATLEERPNLRQFVVARQEPWTVWAGDDPPPLYFSFPDLETMIANVGDPFTHHLEAVGVTTGRPELSEPELTSFDPNDFEEADFETGSTLQVDGAVSATTASEPAIFPGASSSEGVGALEANGEPIQMAYEVQAKLRSASWTGLQTRIEAKPGAKDEVYRQIVLLDRVIEKCGLTNTETQKAKALTSSLIKLVASPEPSWDAVLAVLTSQGMTAFLNVAQIATIFAGLGTLLLS